MARSLLLIICSVCFIVLSHYRESATKVKPRSTTSFSAENAMDYLKVIAAEPHPIGSTANKKVKDYLVKELEALGLETSVESGYVHLSWGSRYCRSAYVENVVAVLPGSDSTAKKVVLAAHYDSVFEGPGAADDGYAVASMLETAKLLKSQPRKNDLQLLITDGEEMGLLGAYFHVKHKQMDDVGILLNYEARGNQGPCTSFEWSDNNAWLVREMKKSSIRPIANSLSYEVYERMRNSSDFTAFSRQNVPGINHAFIDGFSYYHNPADKVENISMNSIQHTGENMYLMAKHFVNYDFSREETGNASFFNFYGVLLHYPASFDLYLLILLGLLIVALPFLIKRKGGVSYRAIVGSFILMLLSLLLVGICNYGLGAWAKMAYPQYATFYSYHYYNHEWYFIGGLGLCVSIMAMISRWLVSLQYKNEQGYALLLLMSLLSLALYVTMPTGAYIMLLPALTLGLTILLRTRINDAEINGLFYIFFLVGMWTFLSHGLFLAFSLVALPGAVLPTALAVLASMYLMPSAWDNFGRKVILGFGLLLFLGSLVIAHIKTKPSEKEPLLTNLKYVYDGESKESYLATVDNHLHAGHQNLLEGTTTGDLPEHLTQARHYKSYQSKVVTLQSSIVADTLDMGGNSFSYSINNPKRASIAYVYLPTASNIDSVFLDKRYNKRLSGSQNKSRLLTVYGFGLDSLGLRFTKLDPELPAKFYVNMEYSGLAEELQAGAGIAWNDPMCYVSQVIEVE